MWFKRPFWPALIENPAYTLYETHAPKEIKFTLILYNFVNCILCLSVCLYRTSMSIKWQFYCVSTLMQNLLTGEKNLSWNFVKNRHEEAVRLLLQWELQKCVARQLGDNNRHLIQVMQGKPECIIFTQWHWHHLLFTDEFLFILFHNHCNSHRQVKRNGGKHFSNVYGRVFLSS